jgi:hypothetical protein
MTSGFIGRHEYCCCDGSSDMTAMKGQQYDSTTANQRAQQSAKHHNIISTPLGAIPLGKGIMSGGGNNDVTHN